MGMFARSLDLARVPPWAVTVFGYPLSEAVPTISVYSRSPSLNTLLLVAHTEHVSAESSFALVYVWTHTLCL